VVTIGVQKKSNLIGTVSTSFEGLTKLRTKKYGIDQ